MLTNEIRSQIDQIWNAFWSGGISNPLEVIEQMTNPRRRAQEGAWVSSRLDWQSSLRAEMRDDLRCEGFHAFVIDLARRGEHQVFDAGGF
jgi:hypothetical protein